MRVALLMNFIAPYRVKLLEALRDRVDELRVFISTPMESDRAWEVDWGSLDVVVQRNLTVRRPYRDTFGFSRQLQIHLPYDTLPQLSRYAPDAVISGELGARSVQAAAWRTLHPASSLLIWGTLSEHSERGWGRMRRLTRQAILRRADGALVNGESGARYIRGFGMPDEQIFRVNQPVDVSLFSGTPRRRPDSSLTRLLHVGALTGRKGLTGFTRTLAEWGRRNPARRLEVWWLGDGEQRAELETAALPPNIAQRFCGNVPYAALPDFYADADLLFFPTLLDEWGLVVNEAMAAGLPVLGSIYSQAVEELVQDGQNGWVFDPLTEASTLVALDRVFATPPEHLAAMREAARRRVMALTPAAAGEHIVRAIDQVARRERSSARRKELVRAGPEA
jgi:glycosyltransferase involved in cell wall biosynthesis